MGGRVYLGGEEEGGVYSTLVLIFFELKALIEYSIMATSFRRGVRAESDFYESLIANFGEGHLVIRITKKPILRDSGGTNRCF